MVQTLMIPDLTVRQYCIFLYVSIIILKDTKVKYDVYLLTLMFALELVRQKSIDVNIKFQCLEQAICVYYFHLDHNNLELVKISRQIVLELIQKGAKYLDDRKEYLELIRINTTKLNFKEKKKFDNLYKSIVFSRHSFSLKTLKQKSFSLH